VFSSFLSLLFSILADNEWRRIRDVEDLEKAIEDAKDVREKEKLQEHLNSLYNQPLRISLFYRLVFFRIANFYSLLDSILIPPNMQ
jgi:hypothetical protein